MGEMSVTMETVQWGSGVLPCRQHNGGEGVTMETAQWEKGGDSTVEGERYYHGDSIVREPAQWRRGALPWRQ